MSVAIVIELFTAITVSTRSLGLLSELKDLGPRCHRCLRQSERHRSLAALWPQRCVDACGVEGSVVARSDRGQERSWHWK